MIDVKLLYFGMVRDILQQDGESLKLEEASNIRGLKEKLFEKYDKLKAYDNFSIAVNESYAEEGLVLKQGDVIALIPPVSGG